MATARSRHSAGHSHRRLSLRVPALAGIVALLVAPVLAAEIRIIGSTPPTDSGVLRIPPPAAADDLLLAQEATVLRLPLSPSLPPEPKFYRCAHGADSRLNLHAYRDEIIAAADASGVPEALIRAVIHAESAFRPSAVSHKNAQGLMQLIPATAERFGVGSPFDPGENIRGGATYLAWLLHRFNGDIRLAAAGYNAGEGRVDQYKGVPPFDETRTYVERVGALYRAYHQALTGKFTLSLSTSSRATRC